VRLSVNKLIFLDFDGVLNRCEPEGWMITRTASGLEHGLVDNVAKLVFLTGAKVVVSSTWREMYSLKRLQKLLEDHGLHKRHVVDVTPDLPFTTRGFEIAAFLAKKRVAQPTQFVVLDDNDFGRFDMDPVRAHLVRTEAQNGFTEKDIDRAQALLTTGPIWDYALQLSAAG